jgi:malate dehydrogenase
METTLNKEGVTYKEVKGTAQEHESLNNSYKHLCALRDELIHSA